MNGDLLSTLTNILKIDYESCSIGFDSWNWFDKQLVDCFGLIHWFDWLSNSLIDWLIGWSMDWLIDRLVHLLIGWLIDWLIDLLTHWTFTDWWLIVWYIECNWLTGLVSGSLIGWSILIEHHTQPFYHFIGLEYQTLWSNSKCTSSGVQSSY